MQSPTAAANNSKASSRLRLMLSTQIDTIGNDATAPAAHPRQAGAVPVAAGATSDQLTADHPRAGIRSWLCQPKWCPSGQRREVADVDVVEGLDDLGLWKVLLEEFTGRRRLVVFLVDVSVTVGVLVVVVDDHLSLEWIHRHLPVCP